MGVRSLDIQGFERGYVGKIDAMNSELKPGRAWWVASLLPGRKDRRDE